MNTPNPFDRNKTKEARLGQLITEPGEQNQRDAIHIAVVPVVADAVIQPGDHLDVIHVGSVTYATHHGSPVGIADPFLREPIEKGQTFWLFLYQGQVTTLRHEWTHPAFPDVGHAPSEVSDKAKSEAWLRAYARRFWTYSTPEEGYRKLLEQMANGELCYEGTDMHDRGDLVDSDELRRHAEIVLGRKINYDDFTYFSCTC